MYLLISAFSPVFEGRDYPAGVRAAAPWFPPRIRPMFLLRRLVGELARYAMMPKY